MTARSPLQMSRAALRPSANGLKVWVLNLQCLRRAGDCDPEKQSQAAPDRCIFGADSREPFSSVVLDCKSAGRTHEAGQHGPTCHSCIRASRWRKEPGRWFATGPPISIPKATEMVGPPPKGRNAPGVGSHAIQDTGVPLEEMQLEDPGATTKALVQQSAAMASLVARLTGGADPLTDLSSASSAGSAIHTRGVARREKMQNELASGSSSYFIQFQQMFRKLNPTKLVPKTEADLIGSGVSMTANLERFGSYRAFAPTRLNVADDPTRDVPLREPLSGLDLQSWTKDNCVSSLLSQS